MNEILNVLFWFFIWFAVFQVTTRIYWRIHRFPLPPVLGYMLDGAFRKSLQWPKTVGRRCGITQGMTVLEVGCGSGAFTTVFARMAGPSGRIFAVDLQEGMLKQLQKKLGENKYSDINNIEIQKADAYELPFSENSFDITCMVTVLSEIPDKQKALAEAMRVLKPGGILSVTEALPDPDYPFKSTTIKHCLAAGFKYEKTLGNLWHYTILFKKIS
jgi:ubiquinone/menaquinone biosynthesis C-methylase UbiE